MYETRRQFEPSHHVNVQRRGTFFLPPETTTLDVIAFGPDVEDNRGLMNIPHPPRQGLP